MDIKLEKMPVLKLVEFSEKQVKKEYIDNVKELLGDDPKALLLSMKDIPKGEKLAQEAEVWRESFNGVNKTVQWAVRQQNPDITDEQMKEYVDSLDGELLGEALKIVYGIDEVDDAKKK